MLHDDTHRVGRVAAVESERLTVELDQAASGLVKAGSFGVLPVGAVNSYVTVTAGASRVVAVVTAVRMLPERASPSVLGRDAAEGVSRTLEATMVGRIQNGTFRSGVTSYPSLFSPVSVATRTDLDSIFRPSGEAMRLGEAAVSPDQDVWLDADRLLTRHFAILGSTGSGKSCTVMAILDGITDLDVPHANVVVFDANGEYSAAFAAGTKRAESVTSFTIGPLLGPDGLSVPLWFMNNEEHMELLGAAEGIQAPILQRSLADARVTGLSAGDALLGLRIVRRTVERLVEIDRSEKNKAQEKIEQQLMGLLDCLRTYCSKKDALESRWRAMLQELEGVADLSLDSNSWNPLTATQSHCLNKMCVKLSLIVREAVADLGLGTQRVAADFDAPSFYSFEDLADVFLPQRIDLEAIADPRIAQFMASLQLRMSRLLADDRYAFMTRVEPFDQALSKFLRLLFGKSPVGDGTTEAPWSESYGEARTGEADGHAITIIDLSHVASDLLEIVTALLARLVHELSQRVIPRGSMPVLLVLEEAHRYVTRPAGGSRTQSSVVFERIAKEGRKFGVSLCLASQRPSELDPTVLSQCGTVIAHRIANQLDQDIIRAATPIASRDVLRQLPGLATQHAIVLGEATPAPVTVRVRSVMDPPNSQDPSFLNRWRDADRKEEAEIISVIGDAWEVGERTKG